MVLSNNKNGLWVLVLQVIMIFIFIMNLMVICCFRTNNTLRMLIDSTGLVGIGEDDPGQILHITHASQPVIRLENSGALSSTAMMGWIEFNYKAYRVGYIGYGLVGTDILYINNEQPNGSIALDTNNQNSLSISAAGRIHTPRLGTGTPVSRLALTSAHEIITIGNESYTSGTVTLKNGTKTRGTGTAYITKNEYTRICTVHLPSFIRYYNCKYNNKINFFYRSNSSSCRWSYSYCSTTKK